MTDKKFSDETLCAFKALGNLQVKFLENQKNVPLCKKIIDFLHYHNVQSFADLSVEQKQHLLSQMGNMVAKISRTSKELLAIYGVTDETLLSGIQRKIFDSRMREVVKNIDHYP